MSALAPALLRRAMAAFQVIPDEARGPALAALDEFLAAPAPATFLAATRILRAQARRAVVETTAGATMRRAFADGVAALRGTAVPPTLIDQIAEETRTFQLVVRGAITAQQDQIAENSRQIAVLITAVQKHDAAIANLEQQWQAYLRRLPPQ